MVDSKGIEPSTLRMRTVRSPRLSYEPMGFFWIIPLRKGFVKEKEDTAACPLCDYGLFFFNSHTVYPFFTRKEPRKAKPIPINTEKITSVG